MSMKFSVSKLFPRKEEGSQGGRSGAPRIPFGLQAIFIASNRGKDVHKPAPSQKVEVQVEEEENVVPKSIEVASTIVTASTDASAAAAPSKAFVVPADTSPQDYLDSILKERGYSTRRYAALSTGYRTKPTELQVASHGTHLVSLIRKGDDKELRKCMKSGLSPNPCNTFGESLLHMVCRHGSHSLLTCMLEAGSDVQVCDDYGRTPMHDACWAPKPDFDAVVLLVNQDRDLFVMMDKRNSTPLAYVRKENWSLWIQFLDSHKDYWWPLAGGNHERYVPPMAEYKPMTRQIPDPKNALSLEMARLVAAGRMTPSEARILTADEEDGKEEDGKEDDAQTMTTASITTLDYEPDEFDSDDDDDDSSEYDSDDSSFDSDEDYDSDDYDDMEEFEGDMDDDEMMRQVERVLNF